MRLYAPRALARCRLPLRPLGRLRRFAPNALTLSALTSSAIALSAVALSAVADPTRDAGGDGTQLEPPTARATLSTTRAVPHAQGRAKLDGSLDDEIWQHALVVDLAIETNPRENEPADVKTTAYLVENGSEFLIAFDARDPDAKSIRAYLRDRDSAFFDDFVGVVLDTFNDERRAFEFFANPLGVQMDLISDDVNRNESSAWNAIWNSAGRITSDGFVVEMAIPFSQLRFPGTAAEQTWGMDILRFRPRTNRTRISNNPQDRNRNCYICQFGKFTGFANAEPGKAIEVVPSLTTTRTDTRVPVAGAAYVDGSFNSDLGVGVRWGITPDITADLALNPDFSQVEADVAQLAENSQFALLYPESRPFFLEGSEYYDSPLEVVFTRTVADPDVGAKLTGRTGRNTFGAFAAKDVVTNLLLPGPLGSVSASLPQEADTVVGRYTRAFGDSSTIGLLATHRSGEGYDNDVAGIDGRWRINDQHTLSYQLLGSHTQYPAAFAAQYGLEEELDGGGLRLVYSHGSRNWYGWVWHQELDPGFRADVGFIPRVDVSQSYGEGGRVWQGPSGKWWTQFQARGWWSDVRDRSGRLLARSFEPGITLNGPWQSYLQLRAGPKQEFWNGQLFDMHGVNLYIQLRPMSGLSMQMQVLRGGQIDYANSRIGDQRFFQPQIDWNITRHLLLRLRYTSNRLSSQTGPTVFRADLTDLRVTWQFNLRSFVRVTLQNQDIERHVEQYRLLTTAPTSKSLGTQLLYSYKLNPQTVFFAGYSDNRLEDGATGLLEPTGRTVFLKLSYAWTP
jgi:hypothetical protein